MCVHGTRGNVKRRVENAKSIPAENEQRATSLMWRKHLINLVEAMTDREISKSMQRTEPERKVANLMLRKHLVNLAEDAKEKGSMRIGINSLVIPWLGTGVARALRMNASEPMVGWKDERPQSVNSLQPVIDKYSHILCN
jgi:hypothetical protein